jgi:hypothetical protein
MYISGAQKKAMRKDVENMSKNPKLSYPLYAVSLQYVTRVRNMPGS